VSVGDLGMWDQRARSADRKHIVMLEVLGLVGRGMCFGVGGRVYQVAGRRGGHLDPEEVWPVVEARRMKALIQEYWFAAYLRLLVEVLACRMSVGVQNRRLVGQRIGHAVLPPRDQCRFLHRGVEGSFRGGRGVRGRLGQRGCMPLGQRLVGLVVGNLVGSLVCRLLAVVVGNLAVCRCCRFGVGALRWRFFRVAGRRGSCCPCARRGCVLGYRRVSIVRGKSRALKSPETMTHLLVSRGRCPWCVSCTCICSRSVDRRQEHATVTYHSEEIQLVLGCLP